MSCCGSDSRAAYFSDVGEKAWYLNEVSSGVYSLFPLSDLITGVIASFFKPSMSLTVVLSTAGKPVTHSNAELFIYLRIEEKKILW